VFRAGVREVDLRCRKLQGELNSVRQPPRPPALNRVLPLAAPKKGMCFKIKKLVLQYQPGVDSGEVRPAIGLCRQALAVIMIQGTDFELGLQRNG